MIKLTLHQRGSVCIVTIVIAINLIITATAMVMIIVTAIFIIMLLSYTCFETTPSNTKATILSSLSSIFND